MDAIRGNRRNVFDGKGGVFPPSEWTLVDDGGQEGAVLIVRDVTGPDDPRLNGLPVRNPELFADAAGSAGPKAPKGGKTTASAAAG